MYRAKTFYIFALLTLAGGLACYVPGAGSALGAGASRLHAVSAICFFLAATAGVAVVVVLRRDCDRLTARLRQLEPSAEPARMVLSETGFAFLARAMGELTDSAERGVAEAALRAKELEVQLKVATAERQHAEAILYSISDAVLVTDPFDELVLANDAAARAFGFDLAASKARPVDQVLHDPRIAELIREMRQNNSKSGRRIIEHAVQTQEGPRTFKLTLSCVAGAGDAPAGVVAVLHDMTREKEVAEMKNDFVSMVSHELRTPLASIRAYVEMLIDGEAPDPKTQQEFYEVIQNEASRLGRLIDDILNVSRIESGLVRVDKQPQSMAVILKEALEVIAPQAHQKHVTLQEKLPAVFYQTPADRDMLYQAVLNLLSNSIKYTPEGGTVSVETTVDEAQKRILTRISDTGVGIPPKDLPFVFDKFYRAEANNRMAPGTGLGLALVKQIVETVHHGRLFVESQTGKGSCFGFELELCE